MNVTPITDQLAILTERIEEASALAAHPETSQETVDAIKRLQLAAQKQVEDTTAILNVAKALDAIAGNVP